MCELGNKWGNGTMLFPRFLLFAKINPNAPTETASASAYVNPSSSFKRHNMNFPFALLGSRVPTLQISLQKIINIPIKKLRKKLLYKLDYWKVLNLCIFNCCISNFSIYTTDQWKEFLRWQACRKTSSLQIQIQIHEKTIRALLFSVYLVF